MNKPTKTEAIEAFKEFKAFWSTKYKSMTRMLNDTTDNIFTFFEYSSALKKAISTSNAIESFNAELKRESREKIISNSEDNATIIITNVCSSYNKSCGRRLLTGLGELTSDQKEAIGFIIKD